MLTITVWAELFFWAFGGLVSSTWRPGDPGVGRPAFLSSWLGRAGCAEGLGSRTSWMSTSEEQHTAGEAVPSAAWVVDKAASEELFIGGAAVLAWEPVGLGGWSLTVPNSRPAIVVGRDPATLSPTSEVLSWAWAACSSNSSSGLSFCILMTTTTGLRELDSRLSLATLLGLSHLALWMGLWSEM